MMKHTLVVSLLLVFAGSSVAMADDDCHVPMDQWQSRDVVQKMAEARGWKVGRIKIDDGCYQIRGIDEKGQAFKAKINPSTLATVKMKSEGQDEDDGDKRDPMQRVESGEAGALSSNELFKTGKPPKIEVK